MLLENIKVTIYLTAAKASLILLMIDLHGVISKEAYTSLTMAWLLLQVNISIVGQPLLIKRLINDEKKKVIKNSTNIGIAIILSLLIVILGLLLIPKFTHHELVILLVAIPISHKMSIYGAMLVHEPLKIKILIAINLIVVVFYLLARNKFLNENNYSIFILMIYIADYFYLIYWNAFRKKEIQVDKVPGEYKKTNINKFNFFDWIQTIIATNSVTVSNILIARELFLIKPEAATIFSLSLQFRSGAGIVSSALNQHILKNKLEISRNFAKINIKLISISVILTIMIALMGLVYVNYFLEQKNNFDTKMFIIMILLNGPIMYFSLINSAVYSKNRKKSSYLALLLFGLFFAIIMLFDEVLKIFACLFLISFLVGWYCYKEYVEMNKFLK
jgi:hypothetical protein